MLNPQLLCVSFLSNLKKGRQAWIWLGALSSAQANFWLRNPFMEFLERKKKKKNTTTLKNF